MHACLTLVRGFSHPCLFAICREDSSSDATLLKPLTSSGEHLKSEPYSSLLKPASTRQDYAHPFLPHKTPPIFDLHICILPILVFAIRNLLGIKGWIPLSWSLGSRQPHQPEAIGTKTIPPKRSFLCIFPPPTMNTHIRQDTSTAWAQIPLTILKALRLEENMANEMNYKKDMFTRC